MVWVSLLGFVVLMLVAGGAFLSLLARRNFRTASLLGRPLSRIGKLRPGVRRVRGQIAPLGEPLCSPATNQPCVYYRLRVYEDRATYRDSSSLASEPLYDRDLIMEALQATYRTSSGIQQAHCWHLLVEEGDEIPSTIDDETGAVEIDLRGAAINSRERARIASNINHPPSPQLEKLLIEKYGIPTVNERGIYKTLHYLEEVLLVGAKVTVVGSVEERKSGAFCFRKEDGSPLLISQRDLGKEGRSAHGRAMGYATGAGVAFVVALVFLIGAVALALRTLPAGR